LININSDVGESFGRWQLGNDAELMRYVPTVNVACGFHAGDPHVLARTMRLVADSGAELGAHVGLPDLLGFGRRIVQISSVELRDYVTYQVGALLGFAISAGLRVRHVKPHGALYAMCGENEEYATALLEAVRGIDSTMAVIAGGRAMATAARATGMTAVPEGYVDLVYKPNGFPELERSKRAWDPEEVAGRAIRLVRDRTLEANDGSALAINVPTICVHGDASNSVDVARVLRERLASAGITVVSLARMLEQIGGADC
jgi:5-oxoprolinase (ATP-hydrolysing) subunit A